MPGDVGHRVSCETDFFLSVRTETNRNTGSFGSVSVFFPKEYDHLFRREDKIAAVQYVAEFLAEEAEYVEWWRRYDWNQRKKLEDQKKGKKEPEKKGENMLKP